MLTKTCSDLYGNASKVVLFCWFSTLKSTDWVVISLSSRIYITSMTNLISADEKKDRNLAFGMRLKAHRQELKITQEELAESVGKSSETISKLERGLVYPGVDMLILLAERLDTTLDSLVGTQSTISMSKKQSALVAQAASTLNTMSEDKLKVAVKQLKALQEL